MAGSAFSAVGSPPSNEDLNSVQDWELLSASTLLAQGHGLGFGLPPLTTPVLHASRLEDDGVSRRDVVSDTELGFILRGKDGSSLSLDASQIAIVCSTSTSSVEPFTEGWKPQFRIAGAPLQENYYAPDPFAPAASHTGSSLEPFLDMEQSFLAEPTRAADNEMIKLSNVDKNPEFLRADYAERCMKRAVSPHQQERDKEEFSTEEGKIETLLVNSGILDFDKTMDKINCIDKNGETWRKSQGFFNRKSYVTWSIALTTMSGQASIHNEQGGPEAV
ncbi:hypothetical protein GOP47_0015672 [Adiantum capillus-veneris]|uniref:Uncharacterized protein n=1 Tax=Adiantum capillus-veneris TaxID=13818 RepID=A0A9D4ZE68_ADICA|nr:hypothetical protein GOP47_0015672 [Adiantum capillus-veneris]